MPILRHLGLTMCEVHGVVTVSPAPLLRSATLSVPRPLNLTLPLGQLTSLVCHLVFREEYVAILRQTGNLVHCELGIFSARDRGLPPEHAIDLPCLESLSLFIMTTPSSMPRYLDDFIVPALSRLRLDESILEPDPIERLTSFISKSGCKLQEVSVTERPLMSASFREAFPSIPRFSFDDDPDAASSSTHS
ncbi:hypothetical protein K438DRAFT_440430 [Mycena galopus ATCC 62051]|nr:hypothetical protein K438DRAFT_440430 [Mycena galopus ATCC 62051]